MASSVMAVVACLGSARCTRLPFSCAWIVDIGDSEIGDSGGDSEMGKSGDSEMGDSGGGHEVIRSCVGGNGDDDDVSWLCQVQAAPDLMCWILVMVTLIFVILFGMILL